MDPVSVSLLDLVRSHDFLDLRLLNLHLRSALPDSAVFLEAVQQDVVVGSHAKMNVDVLAHVIWIFRLFWSHSFVQLMVVVQLMVMRDSQLQSPHLIHHQVLE